LPILYEIKIIIVNGAYAVFSGISYGIFQPWLQGFRSESTSEYRTLVMMKLDREKVFIEEDHIGLYIKKRALFYLNTAQSDFIEGSPPKTCDGIKIRCAG